MRRLGAWSLRLLGCGTPGVFAAVWFHRQPHAPPPARQAAAPGVPSAQSVGPEVPVVEVCHSRPLTAVPVPVVRRPGSAPSTGHSEPLRDGDYDIASYEVYGDISEDALGKDFAQTVRVSGNGRELAVVKRGRSGVVSTSAFLVEGAPPQWVLTGTCPRALVNIKEAVRVEAHGLELRLVFPQLLAVAVVTLQRRAS